jgi:hypothetical protein
MFFAHSIAQKKLERFYQHPHVGFDQLRTCPRFGSGS